VSLVIIVQLDEMKEYDPDLYRVARLGRFGINGVKVLPQFEVKAHAEIMEFINSKQPFLTFRAGMDFGFEESYNALIRVAIDKQHKHLYIYYEYYKNKMTDDKTAIEISEFKETKERIRADSAEPKTIEFFSQQGFNMVAAQKFQGSRLQYTKKIKRFKKIFCSDRCENTIFELQTLTYKKNKNDEVIPDEFSIDPHTLSAIWYALDDYEVSDLKDKVGIYQRLLGR